MATFTNALHLAPETDWSKSSYSGPNGACVERTPVMALPAAAEPQVGIRDSKDRSGPAFTVGVAAFAAFTAYAATQAA